MKRNEVKKLQKNYDMEILRNEITQEAFAVYCETKELIPELDMLVDQSNTYPSEHTETYPCVINREAFGDTYRYTIHCPKEWFDLHGWADE